MGIYELTPDECRILLLEPDSILNQEAQGFELIQKDGDVIYGE